MITLITGAPGAGKSAAMVDMIRTLYKDRQCFVSGIPDFQLPHIALDDPTKWPSEVPDGALIVIDEVQRVWRPVGPTAKVTDDIAMLETHRHRGLDFLLVTQQPGLMRTNVRALVGRHVHLRDLGILGRWWYEWPECNSQLAYKSAPIRKRYSLPKKAFALYKSASLHVKPERSIPPALIIAIACILGASILALYTWRTLSSKVQGTPETPVNPTVGVPPSFSTAATTSSPSPVSTDGITARTIQADFTPRIRSRPETAPAYDHLRVVTAMPMVTGGFILGKIVFCHTDQGTKAQISDDECRAWIANPPHNPYKTADAAQRQQHRLEPPAAPQSTAPTPSPFQLPSPSL
ncbi:MAG: zonular occludens toxin domain-containing protein [Oligoflexus sp.]